MHEVKEVTEKGLYVGWIESCIKRTKKEKYLPSPKSQDLTINANNGSSILTLTFVCQRLKKYFSD